jgi:Skp family chaperone for outer membrane proteins
MWCFEKGIMMKNLKTSSLVVVVAILVLMGAYQQGKLNASAQIQPAKIGIVNMTRVFEESTINKQWREKMQQEQTNTRNEINQMKTELDAIQANLKLRTPGSEDFLKLRQDMVQKKSLLEARETVYREKVNFQLQQMAEDFHKRLLEVTADLAKEKGLDIIATDELADFVQMTKSKVLLYHNSQYDLTDEVLAILDKEAK